MLTCPARSMHVQRLHAQQDSAHNRSYTDKRHASVLVTLFKSQHSPSLQALLFQAAADSDVANLPASSTSRFAIDLTAPASDQPSMLPLTAGAALLAIKLDEDQVVLVPFGMKDKVTSKNHTLPSLLLQIDARTCILSLVHGIFTSMHAQLDMYMECRRTQGWLAMAWPRPQAYT